MIETINPSSNSSSNKMDDIDLSKPLESSRKFGKHAKIFENSANPLLVTHQVGKGKKSVYDLPPQNFSYGKPSPKDGESAGNGESKKEKRHRNKKLKTRGGNTWSFIFASLSKPIYIYIYI